MIALVTCTTCGVSYQPDFGHACGCIDPTVMHTHAPALTEERVRMIVREELAKVAAELRKQAAW